MFCRKLHSFLLFIVFFVSTNVSSEGFIAGTLIKTKDKYVPIEKLKENDLVISYSFESKQLIESKILKVKKERYKKCIKLNIEGNEIITAPNHKFYLPIHESKRWVEASQLKPQDYVLKNVKGLAQIDEVVQIIQDVDFYCLALDKHHNFFISSSDILVHNFLVMPFIYAVGAWLTSTFEVHATVSLFGIAAIAAGKLTKSNRTSNTGIKITGIGLAGGVLNMAGTKEDKLPKSGDITFVPKKHKGKDLIRDENGGYIDNKDDSWNWDPKKNEWDVVGKDGHKNVNTDGKETHAGTHPGSSSSTSKSKRKK